MQIGRQYRADLVIWGEVAKPAEGVLLHFPGAGQALDRPLTISSGFLERAYREPVNSLLGLLTVTAALDRARSRIPEIDSQWEKWKADEVGGAVLATARELGCPEALANAPPG